MTDAIISVVVEQLASFLLPEAKLIVCVRKDVDALTSTLEMVQAVLCDAETRQIKDKVVKLWLERLKVIVYDAEDVLDEWNTRNHCSRLKGVEDGGVRIHKKVLSYLLPLCFSTPSVVVRYKFGSRIKEIRERLDVVNHEKEQFGLTISHPSHEETRDDRQTSSVINVENIYGRDHDKNFIVSLLSGESSAQVMNTNVISIVGTGGFGKTTLANLVLADGKVKEIFEKRIFVCVSEPFQLLKVARSIIEQVGGNPPSENERELVLQCLLKNLTGKRFLIVLDDVWTENTNDWDPLKLAFDVGDQGSWVIVTTRSEKVAEMMHSKPYNLEKLSDSESWLLFKHIAFGGREEEFVLKFEEIGKEIAAKCKGVPLAIKIVGGLMHSRKTINEWNHVLTSEIWGIEEIEKGISPSFFLSYNPLPSKLKPCFMYCAIFPKDSKIHKDKLVKLWMAQGFLGSGGDEHLEKTGCDYFDDLVMRSFFQDFEKGPNGNITSCKMHDLVHDFALFLTKGEYSFLEVGKELEGKKVRHLVTASVENSSIYTAKNLRTLLVTKSVNSDQLIKIFNQLKRIRILDLRSQIEELPKQVKELLHLRYLDLSGNFFEELPETICHLFNLQTLKLNNCWKLIKLPAGIGNLLNLRHLELEGTNRLSCIPRGIVRLRYLRSLSKFIVGNASNECKISELKDFRYLKGSLQIVGLERVADASEVAQAELKNKSISILSLKFGRLEEGESEKMTSVLENFQPHEDVEKLNIYGFSGSRFPSWISNRSMLGNLLRLKLSECDYTTKLPALGNLASLEELSLRRMKSLKHIGCEFYGFDDHNDTTNPGVMAVAFPKLKVLEIVEMNKLVEWELPIARDNKKIMPCLSELNLWDCPMLRALPGLWTLESLEDLYIENLPMIKQVGLEFLGISGGDEFGGGEGEGEGEKAIVPNNLRNICSAERKGSDKREGGSSSSSSYVPKTVLLFPKLTHLEFRNMEEWEVWILPPFQEDIQIMPRLTKLEFWSCPKLRALPDLTRFKSLEILFIWMLEGLVELEREEGISLLPCLRELTLWCCTSLRVIPGYLFPHTLRKLEIGYCPQLRGVQPCLPPLLESLRFKDVGVFSESLPIAEDEENNNYPNLKKFQLSYSKHPSLPKGFNHLTAIQYLSFDTCESFDFDLNELKHLTMLKELQISECPILAKRFQSSGDDWMTILSHVPNIVIGDEYIKGSYYYWR